MRSIHKLIFQIRDVYSKYIHLVKMNCLPLSRSWLIGEQTDSYSLFWSIAILISKSTKWDIDINIYKVRYSCTNLSSAYFKFLTNHLRMIDQSTEEVVITFDSDTVNDGLLWLEYLDRQRVSIAVPINTCVLKDL